MNLISSNLVQGIAEGSPKADAHGATFFLCGMCSYPFHFCYRAIIHPIYFTWQWSFVIQLGFRRSAMKLCLSPRMFIVPGTRDEFSLNVEEFIQFAREAGYDGIALRPGQLDEKTTPEELASIGEILEKTETACSFAMGGRASDEEGYRKLCKLIDDAVTIGCSHVQPSVGDDSEIPWIQRACDHAAEKDVRLCPQLHDQTLHDTVANCKQLFERVDRANFGLNFEASHLILQESELRGGEALKALADKIFTVCVQNYRRLDGNSVAVLPGDAGGVNFEEVIEAAREIGFDGYITHMSGSYPDLDNTTVCKAYVEALRPLMS
jgi:sugar phosphate isomerase/epimerase